MKRLILPIISVLLIGFSVNMKAQNLGRIIRKTVVEPSRVANDIAEDKAEEEAEKHMTKAIMEGFGLSEDVQWDEQYKFEAWFEMTITEYNKNGKVDDQVMYNNYIHPTSGDYGMEFMDDDTRSTILFDSDKYAMIILSEDDGDKTGFATKFDPAEVEEATEDEVPESGGLKPVMTGNTKKILGYSCDEYLLDDEEMEVHMWISEKLGKELSKEMLSNSNAFGAAFQYASVVEGMVLEYDVIDKRNGEKTEMLVTDLDLKKSHAISTEGFQIITMNLQDEEEE